MQYLTYDEYTSLGGTLDAAAFNRYIDRSCGIIDNATHNRIECMVKTPAQVKALCRDLLEYLARNMTSDMVVSNRSQSAGAVSESESYVIKSKDELQSDIDEMILDYLMSVRDDNGTPLLYRGCSR